MTREVMSVTGPVDVESLGVVMPHEHLIANAHTQWIYPEDRGELDYYTQAYTAQLHGGVQLEPFSFRSAMQQLDLDVAREELDSYLGAGGHTVVDLGIPGFGRDPVALKALSELTGATVIMGCGEYVEHSHSPYVKFSSAEVVRDVLLDEIENGVGNTGVRPGIIGEIGTGNPPTAEERKVVRGAALAQMESGLALNLHRTIFPDPLATLPVVDEVLEMGVDPRKLIVSHCDERPESEFAFELARRGCWVELDTFGMEQWAVSARRGDDYPPRSFDHHRIELLVALLDAGYGDRVLLSHDIAMKPQFTHYGGWGLRHLLRGIRPQLAARGITDEVFTRLTVENPVAALA
ncbi:phosphotriesterase family protein [Rhodococcus sp. NPDC003348]